MHINILKLKAVYLALLKFTRIFPKKAFHVQIDNMIALTYLVKMRGSSNQQMRKHSKQIQSFLLSREVTITAEYLPGDLNIREDVILRTRVSGYYAGRFSNCYFCIGFNGHASLCLQGLSSGSSIYDMEARSTEQRKRCISTKVISSVSSAFPLFCITGKVLDKVRLEKITIVLITLLWQTQLWCIQILKIYVENLLLLLGTPQNF